MPCNLSEGIRAEAKKRALKKGYSEEFAEEYAKGYAEGYSEGRVNTRIEDAMNLMKSLKLSAEDALEALRVPAKSRKTLFKAINERLAVE